jgi:hypothetical protein
MGRALGVPLIWSIIDAIHSSQTLLILAFHCHRVHILLKTVSSSASSRSVRLVHCMAWGVGVSSTHSKVPKTRDCKKS